MPRIFVDLDGVLVDFAGFMAKSGLSPEEVKRMNGAYLSMEPIAGALEGIRSLIGIGFEVWIASKPPTGVPHAYADKAEWVMRNLPELKRKIILTHDKGLLGSADDFLIDDRPHKANCHEFRGTLIVFGGRLARNWDDILCLFRPAKAETATNASVLGGHPIP